MEIELPIEFAVFGTAPSQAASSRTKQAWKSAIREASKPLLPEMPFSYEGPASVTLYYFPVEVMPGDIDNRIKTVLDSIKGYILRDDSQVLRIVAQVFNPGATFAFTDPSGTLAEAIGSDEPALYSTCESLQLTLTEAEGRLGQQGIPPPNRDPGAD